MQRLVSGMQRKGFSQSIKMPKYIDNISDNVSQLIQVTLDDGSAVTLTLNYRPAIQRWTMDVAYGTFSCYGIVVTNHYNILKQWRKYLGFGIGITSNDGVDPVNLTDFDSGRSVMHLLNADDMATLDATLVAPAP
jgi:hypothetical protein